MGIKGITVYIYEKIKEGEDPFGTPIYAESKVAVENVLVSPVSSEDIVNNKDLHGGKAVYTLGIPKGDNHNWRNTSVEFFGEKWQTFGEPLEGIEENIPLMWNKKVMVERYE